MRVRVCACVSQGHLWALRPFLLASLTCVRVCVCVCVSGAPLGAEVEEEGECQSRGMAAAVRAGFVEAGSLMEGLAEYCKVCSQYPLSIR